MKRRFWDKKVQKATWGDLLKGSLLITGLTTLLAGIPFIGYLIKESLD
jgi:hypothetical protein